MCPCRLRRRRRRRRRLLVNPKYLPGGLKPKKKYRNSGVLYCANFELSAPVVAALSDFPEPQDGTGHKPSSRREKLQQMDTAGHHLLHFKFGADQLDRKDGRFLKSDPYAVFSRDHVPLIHRTNTIHQVLNPEWEDFEVTEREVPIILSPRGVSTSAQHHAHPRNRAHGCTVC